MFTWLFHLLTSGPALPVFAAVAAAAADVQPPAQWPNGPFTTSESWIMDARGDNFTYAGVNWPGAAETMVPEGLQYQSVEAIVSRVKSLGMNSIRLTYATEMIDQVYDNNMTDVPILTSFVGALGEENGTDIFDRVIANNPTFDRATTRLQVSTGLCFLDCYNLLDSRVPRRLKEALPFCALRGMKSGLTSKLLPGVRCHRGRMRAAEHLRPP